MNEWFSSHPQGQQDKNLAYDHETEYKSKMIQGCYIVSVSH